ncbi:hypothetical protein [Streptomyces sp. NPDC057910]|uniref:hypothetical protein n=1 Tax=Streptomyces sp. NPDC057910 TaxID=3346278 RepID=UPI0036E114E8
MGNRRPSLQDSEGPAGLPTRAYQALQTWPAHNLTHDLWQEILAFLPLEDQTRLAHTSHPMQDIVEQLAPQALDPAAHNAPGFIRTIYTQTELNTSLNTGQWVDFIPGTDSDLTIGRGLAHVHGPGTLASVTDDGFVTALDDPHITTVTGGTVHAYGQASITTVTDGNVYAYEQTSIEDVTGGHITPVGQATIATVTGGTVHAHDQATITTVTGGNVSTVSHARITTVTGGKVRAGENAAVTRVTGGDLYAAGQSTISEVSGGAILTTSQSTIGDVSGGTVTAAENAVVTVVGGDAHIIARGNTHVTIEASAGGVHVDANDAAHITAHSGTVTIHSPDVTVTSKSDSNAVINHA